MLYHEHIISTLTESFMSVYHSEPTTPESVDNLDNIVMDRLRNFHRFVLGVEETTARHCLIKISQESDSEVDKTLGQNMFIKHSSEETEVPQAGISKLGLEVVDWLEYKDDNMIIKYNAKSIKDVTVTFSLVDKPEEEKHTKNEVHTGPDSSDSGKEKEIGHNKNIVFGYQVEHRDREATMKDSMDQDSLSRESHVLGVCNCKRSIFCREFVAMKSEAHQFLLATAKCYIKDKNKIILSDFIEKFFKQVPDHLQDYFLKKSKALQMYIESEINVEYLEYCIYNMLHIIYEECVYNDAKTSGQMSVTFISDVLVNFWHYDVKKLHFRALGNRDGGLGEWSSHSSVILYPSEINKSEEDPGSKYDRQNEPFQKWLKEVAETCHNSNGCLNRDIYELIKNAFNGIKSPELHRGVREYIELVITRSSDLVPKHVKIENIWNALQNAMNMCRISDEILGFKDLDTVLDGLSRILPSPSSYEIFQEMQKAHCKTENSMKHCKGKKMEYNNDMFVETSSSSNNTENLVRNHSLMDMRNETHASTSSILNSCRINPKFEKNQNSDMNTFEYSEAFKKYFKIKTKNSKNSEVMYPKETEEIHPQVHSDKTILSINAGAYHQIPSHNERYEGAPSYCSNPSDKNPFLQSMARGMHHVLPLKIFQNTYGLAVELVSKGNAINDYYMPLAEIVHSNGLPVYLRNYSKWENLMSNVQRSESKTGKANVVYDWLLPILKECFDKDGGKRGFHCFNVIKQFNDLTWSLRGINRFESRLNFRPKAKLWAKNLKLELPRNLKLELPKRSVTNASGSDENKSKRKDNRKTCVSPPTTVSADLEEKMESESIDIPCTSSSMKNACDGLEVASSACDAGSSCGSSKDHTKSAKKVIHERMTKEHTSKSFVEQADAVIQEEDSEKKMKPENMEKDCNNGYDMLDSIETDSNEEYSPNPNVFMGRFETIDLNECMMSKRK